jgi:hypothetical protein
VRRSSAERGYGPAHVRLRAQWAIRVERGEVFCRCGRWIAPGSKWHLGHDHRNGGYTGPEHERCNIGERNRRHARRRRVRSEVW